MGNESTITVIEPGGDSSDGGSIENLTKAYDLLQQLLNERHGIVSTRRFKRRIMEKLEMEEGEAGTVMDQLLDETAAQRIGRAKAYHLGRSFYSREKYEEALQQTESEANRAAQQVEKEPEEKEESTAETKQNRREEAKLVRWIKSLLEDIYESEHAPDDDDYEYVFDVHSARPGSSFENVDILAVHWRSEENPDLVTVEVKLQFSAQAVHQACNYARFSNRVWIAVRVAPGDVIRAAKTLRNENSGLFDYAVSSGLGIIACRRMVGRDRWEAFPVHWPRFQQTDPVERAQFIKRYRSVLEKAKVVPQKESRRSVALS